MNAQQEDSIMFTCQFCSFNYYDDIAPNNEGFWCADCDGFTYLDENIEKHRFVLVLEDKNIPSPNFNTPKIQFNKRLSPYRYPGGKSKVIDYLFTHLHQSKAEKLISPFTGGGSFELSLLEAGVLEHLHINDLDTGVYSLWWTIKYMPFALIDRIQTIKPTHKDYFSAQALIKSDYVGADAIEAAWASLLVNRLAYSGIHKANPLGGKSGTKSKLLSRWNPEVLVKRIQKIHKMSDKIEVTNINAVELIEEAYWDQSATIFIDPPFVNKGKELYHCFYTKDDHLELALLLDSLHSGFPGADILVTYDYSEWLNNLYDYPERKIIGRKYSV